MTMRYAHLAPQHSWLVEKLWIVQPSRQRATACYTRTVTVENELTPELTPTKIAGLPVGSEKVQKVLLDLANPAHAGT